MRRSLIHYLVFCVVVVGLLCLSAALTECLPWPKWAQLLFAGFSGIMIGFGWWGLSRYLPWWLRFFYEEENDGD